MRVLAPAKINLNLRVGGVRPDGFHPLLTWMCTVALFDILDIRRAGGEGTTSLTIADGDDDDVMAASEISAEELLDGSGAVTTGITVGAATGPSVGRDGGIGDGKSIAAIVPADSTNLVVRAASSWVKTRQTTTTRQTGSTADRGISIVLGKRIPVGAGLGGGSSDAARTLLTLNRLDDAGLSLDQLAELGATLGSDVPFFFHGPSSICRGRGEIVTPVAGPDRAKWCILYLPGISLSTAHIFQRFDELKLGSNVTVETDWSSWATLPAEDLMSRLVNDLEAPAFDVCPALGELRATLSRVTGGVVRMSGSGSSLFSLADDHATAMGSVVKARESYQGRIEVVRLCPALD